MIQLFVLEIKLYITMNDFLFHGFSCFFWTSSKIVYGCESINSYLIIWNLVLFFILIINLIVELIRCPTTSFKVIDRGLQRLLPSKLPTVASLPSLGHLSPPTYWVSQGRWSIMTTSFMFGVDAGIILQYLVIIFLEPLSPISWGSWQEGTNSQRRANE